MRYIRYAGFMLAGFMILITLSALTSAQVAPDPETVAKIRTIEAENASLKRERDLAVNDAEYWKASSNRWQGLYQKGNQNTDENIGDALRTRDLQIVELRRQHETDKDRIDDLENRVSSLKRQRIYIALGSGALGAGAGFLACQQSGASAPTIINNPAPRPASGFKIRF